MWALSSIHLQKIFFLRSIAAREGEILAVNGPPGTGKTTLLLSVVASLWAKAALEGDEPPVILAASANNQAVTNIIDAFGQDFATGTGPLAGRWLPHVKSFGAYFPSNARKGEAAGQYQTRRFFEDVESEKYVATAKEHYLQAAAAAFPELEQPAVASVITKIQQVLRAEAQKLSTVEAAWAHLTEAREAVRNELGDDPAAAMTERLDRFERLKAEKAACDTLAERWESYLAQESIFYSLFAWLPPVARKRLRLARLFLRDTWRKEFPPQDWRTVDQIENAIHALVIERNQALSEQQFRVQRGEGVLQAEQQRVQEWKVALEPLLRAGNDACPTLADVDALADKLIRFPIFLLTTHYWEGRWLLEMKELLPEIEQEKARTG